MSISSPNQHRTDNPLPQAAVVLGPGRRTRSTRPTFSLTELRKHDSIPVEEIPEWSSTHGIQTQRRRWQDYAEEIIELSSRGRALPITIPIGINIDAIQAGVREELKRFKYRSHTRKTLNIDGTTTMYFYAEPLADQQEDSTSSKNTSNR